MQEVASCIPLEAHHLRFAVSALREPKFSVLARHEMVKLCLCVLRRGNDNNRIGAVQRDLVDLGLLEGIDAIVSESSVRPVHGDVMECLRYLLQPSAQTEDLFEAQPAQRMLQSIIEGLVRRNGWDARTDEFDEGFLVRLVWYSPRLAAVLCRTAAIQLFALRLARASRYSEVSHVLQSVPESDKPAFHVLIRAMIVERVPQMLVRLWGRINEVSLLLLLLLSP